VQVVNFRNLPKYCDISSVILLTDAERFCCWRKKPLFRIFWNHYICRLYNHRFRSCWN